MLAHNSFRGKYKKTSKFNIELRTPEKSEFWCERNWTDNDYEVKVYSREDGKNLQFIVTSPDNTPLSKWEKVVENFIGRDEYDEQLYDPCDQKGISATTAFAIVAKKTTVQELPLNAKYDEYKFHLSIATNWTTPTIIIVTQFKSLQFSIPSKIGENPTITDENKKADHQFYIPTNWGYPYTGVYDVSIAWKLYLKRIKRPLYKTVPMLTYS